MFDRQPKDRSVNYGDYATLSRGIHASLDIVVNEDPTFFGLNMDFGLNQDKPIWIHKEDGPRFLAQVGLAMTLRSTIVLGRFAFVWENQHSDHCVVIIDQETDVQIWLDERNIMLFLYEFINSGYDFEAVETLRTNINLRNPFKFFDKQDRSYLIEPMNGGITYAKECPVCHEMIEGQELGYIFIDGMCWSCEHNKPGPDEYGS